MARRLQARCPRCGARLMVDERAVSGLLGPLLLAALSGVVVGFAAAFLLL